MHDRRVEFLQHYNYVLKHKVEIENRVADVLICHRIMLSVMNTEVVVFEKIKDTYELYPDFRSIFTFLRDDVTFEVDDFLLQGGYHLFLQAVYLSHLLERFLSLGITCWGLAGNFGLNNTIEAVKHRFYWPSLKRDVARLIGQCRICQLAKQHKQNMGLYTPLRFQIAPGKMFVLCLVF